MAMGALASGTFGAAGRVTIAVTFSNPVTVAGRPALVLGLAGGVSRRAVYAGGSGSDRVLFTYVVRPDDRAPAGPTVAPAIDLRGGRIVDDKQLDVALAVPATTLNSVRIDAVVPRVTGVTVPTAGRYVPGSTLTFVVTFSERVRVSGVPMIQVKIGSTTRLLTYVAGTGTRTLTFTYTVGKSDAVGAVTLGQQIELGAGATLRDAAGNAADLVLPAVDLSRVRVARA